MNPSDYALSIPNDFRRRLAAGWLLFGIVALLISGLFVVLILISRTPGLAELFPVENFFHLAIVVHVDFSVLIWFGACAAVLWTLASRAEGPVWGWLGLALAILGAAMVSASPFRPGQALMSNYVPVLHQPLFLSGLSLFAGGLAMMAVRSLRFPLPIGVLLKPGDVLRFGIHTSAIAAVLAGGALIWSLLAMPDFLNGAAYFETLFWGSGHLLQFVWVQLMLVAWLWLAGLAGVPIALSSRLVVLALLAGVLPAFLAVWAYLAFAVGSPQHRQFFIWLMAAGGGLAAGPIGLALLVGWWRSRPAADTLERAWRATLIFSITLFATGGALGFLITDSNTLVPAHYHGCIVAITLAFMMLSLHVLPILGFARPGPRLMLAIPWVYGVGQFLHVSGLAISGGHGAQRKTAVATQGLEGIAQFGGMLIMGIGGLIAIVGGVLFLMAVARSLRGPRPAVARAPTWGRCDKGV